MIVTRRQFAITTGAMTAAIVIAPKAALTSQDPVPWYRRVSRWGQANNSYLDVANYDVSFWRSYWKRTGTQVILCNGYAGFAAFTSSNPLIARSPFAPNRDLLGEIAAAAHADGVYLVARMDSGVIRPEVRNAYVDWQVRDATGRQTGAMCINSPFRATHVYPVYKEIRDKYGVVAFTDNGGLGGTALCYCDFCKTRWTKEMGGGPLPERVDNSDPLYRRWKRWNATVIISAWEDFNRYVQSIGGPDCLYMGMVRKGSALNREIAMRSPILMMDMQSRNDAGSFHELVDEGRYMHSMLGWDKPMAIASALYHHSHGYYRLTADPPVEARMYMKGALAGGVYPWWHTVASYTPDRRLVETPPPVFAWIAKNEKYIGGTPIATAGLVRSDDDTTFFSRPSAGGNGGGFGGAGGGNIDRAILNALFANRVPYYPVNMKDFARHAKTLPVIVLADINCMSDEDCATVRAYVRNGGSLVVTGMSSLYDQDGEQRQDLGLADVLGANLIGPIPERTTYERGSANSYLRLSGAGAARHAALRDFDLTDAIPFGGIPVKLRVATDRQVLATYAAVQADGRLGPSEPNAPAIIAGTFGKGRVVYVPVDLDRRLAQTGSPDQARLLANLVRWCANGNIPVEVGGPGLVGAYLNHQDAGKRHVLFLLNGSGIDGGNEITDQTYPVGPLRIRVRAPADFKGRVRLLTADRTVPARLSGGMAEFQLDRLDDFEVAVLE
jgi:hypothetical protein